MPRAPRRALAAALAFTVGLAPLSGCSRCGVRPKGPPIERHLPASAAVTLLIPSLDAAAAEIGALYRTVIAFPAAADLADASGTVKTQLGLDPLDPKALAGAGIDPARGAGAAFRPDAPMLLALPLLDRARFDALVLRLARERMGAGQRTTAERDGRTVVSYRRDTSAPPALSYVVVGDIALLAPGPRGLDTVAAAAALAPEASLAKSAGWLAARAALGDGLSALAFAPAGSPALAGVEFARDGVALGLRAGASRLFARAALLLSGERMSFWRAVAGAAPGTPRPGAPEAAALDPDASLVARFSGEFSALAPWLLPRLGLPAARLARLRVDLRRDVLDALAPGAAISISLAPSFELGALSGAALDPVRCDPFRVVQAAFLGRVRDAARARAVLGRIEKSAPRLGARVVARPFQGGGTAWRGTFGRTELAWALLGDRLLVAGGSGGLDALERLASGEPGYRAPTPASRAALDSGIAAAILDFRHLVASLRALPQTAYGTGPNAFVMRSLVERLLDPAARLRDATLRIDLGERAALIELDVEGENGAGEP